MLRDTFSLLGSSKCEVLSVLDLKDAFHSLQLSEKSQKYCGIHPYFGSASYLYQRMPMGLNVSPPIWQTYINTFLNSLQSRKYCEVIMDDLLFITIFIKERRVCVKPLHSRLEAIQKIKAPTTAKQCKSFAGMVNFVSIFSPELQRLLKPIYDLMRKGRQFVWGKRATRCI